MSPRTMLGALVALALGAAGCETRAIAPRGPTWEDVSPVFVEACVECHGEARAESSYRLDGYVAAIACPAGAAGSAVEPSDASALVVVLARDDHRALLDDADGALVRAWVEGGAPARVGAAHPLGWIDPRSAGFHGAVLRAEGWTRLLDPGGPGACARCHAGAEQEPAMEGEPTRGTAPGATACTTCHREEDGPFACATCHGTPGRAFPPRDPCFHPDEIDRGGAHAAHVEGGVGCETCHGLRDVEGLGSSAHGNGAVEIAFDPARAGEGAWFDASARTCASTCHDRGGTLAVPSWTASGELDCASCHQSPPAGHWPGRCDGCHAEASADGSSLVASLLGARLHANGRVDLGDGSGGCGACHGRGEDPTPTTGAHAAHAAPESAAPIACEACHSVPLAVNDVGHLDASAGAEVVFGARATARGASPSYEGGTCREVACHGAGLDGGAVIAPRWSATDGTASSCGACHGLPPPDPHPARDGCSTLGCHGEYSTPGPGVSELGRAVHTDGTVDLWP